MILPQDEVLYFPNASDVIVLGCQEGAYVDALAVVVIKEQKVVYVRPPGFASSMSPSTTRMLTRITFTGRGYSLW